METYVNEVADLNISDSVEKYILSNGGSYIDAVLGVCEKNDIDPIIAAKELSKPIKEKLEIEGIKLNILRSEKGKKGKLPF